MELYEKLEFDKICKEVAALSSSDVVSEHILQTTTTDDIKTANALLTQTADAMSILASSKPDLAFDDIEKILSKARIGVLLAPGEFLTIKRSIVALRSL